MNALPITPAGGLRELLEQTPLFAGLTKQQLDALVEASSIIDLPVHKFLFRIDQPIRAAYLLVSGTIKRTTLLSSKTSKVIELIQPTSLVALGELFAATRYKSSCETIAPCTLVAIELRKFRNLARKTPELGWQILSALAKQHCETEFDMVSRHYSLTGTQRLLDYFIELAGDRRSMAGETTIRLGASKKVIASQIGMTPESFSRNLRQLTEQGILFVEGRNVHIQNAALLKPGKSVEETPPIIFPRKPKTSGPSTSKPLPPGNLINLCGKQRMLSQRMAIAWMMLGCNITPSRTRAKLRQLESDFIRNLTKLGSNGLPDLLAEKLAALEKLWPAYREALFESEPTLENAGRLLELSEETLDAADKLTRQAELLASRPEAHYVNIAGRNRMLSQRCTKLYLFREWGLPEHDIPRRLEASFQEFDRNLSELRRLKLPGPELQAQMDIVAEHWQKLRSVLNPGMRNSSGIQHMQTVLAINEALLRHVDTTVKLYERFAD